ncbi:MAG: FecR family protein [Treponema sp.]|nr:FecR family protein [Treponema sp.]
MKKFILALLITTVSLSSFAMQATVVSTKGKAEVQKGTSWVPLKTGDSLDQGSVIQTGFKSEIILKIKESTVTVAPLSRITLKTLVEREGINGAQAKDETSIYLDTGTLKSNVKKTADRRVGFTVRSPVATASVRGTEFSFGTKFKSTELSTSSGKVAFWKNTKQSEKALNAAAANPEAPAEEAGQGDEAQDISEYAPVNAVVVSQGQEASASTSGGMSSPAKTAMANAAPNDAGTRTAAQAESIASEPAANGHTLPAGTQTETKSSTGSLTITVTYGD